jgi:hypothetical protein
MRANVSHANAHTRTGTRKSLALHMHMRFYVLTCVHVRARACVCDVGEQDVLLLTTTVGGLGLNLTGADTVVFVEHDWNPMKDLQVFLFSRSIARKRERQRTAEREREGERERNSHPVLRTYTHAHIFDDGLRGEWEGHGPGAPDWAEEGG